jgi:hypothetical protein
MLVNGSVHSPHGERASTPQKRRHYSALGTTGGTCPPLAIGNLVLAEVWRLEAPDGMVVFESQVESQHRSRWMGYLDDHDSENVDQSQVQTT